MLASAATLAAGAVALHLQAAFTQPDQVAEEENVRRVTALAAAGPLALAEAAPEEAQAAFAKADLRQGERSALGAESAAGRLRLLQLSIVDSDAEDGDVAEVRSAGLSQVVRLTKAPQVIVVPVGPDNTIAIVGAIDGGGGGVTVGLWLPSGPLALPPLSVGQVLRIPVAPGR